MHRELPLILDPADLVARLGTEDLLIVDLCRADGYARQHIPGAVHVNYTDIVAAAPPVMGLLPDDDQLSEVFSSIGLTGNSHVVAYDDEGGAKAARLLWTLDVIGHPHYSLLDGGLRAWLAGGYPVDDKPARIVTSAYRAAQTGAGTVDMAYLLEHLNDPAIGLLDTRSPAEYQGSDERAERGGHIPGATNMDWVLALDADQRLKPEAELRALLTQRGITPDKEVIVYCQTHHRSSHTYIALKSLGYRNIKGYPGAWSEWGNHPDTPVET